MEEKKDYKNLIILSIGFILIMLIAVILNILSKEKTEEILEPEVHTVSKSKEAYTQDDDYIPHYPTGTLPNTTTSVLQTERCKELLNNGFVEINKGSGYYNRYFKRDKTTISIDNYGGVDYVGKIINRSDLKNYDSRNELELLNKYYKMSGYTEFAPTLNKLLSYASKDKDIIKVEVTFNRTVLYAVIEDDEISFRAYNNGYNYGKTDDLELYTVSAFLKSGSLPYKQDLAKYLLDIFMNKNEKFIRNSDYVTTRINELNKYNNINIRSKYHFQARFSSDEYDVSLTYGEKKYQNQNAIDYVIKKDVFNKEYNTYLNTDFTYLNKKYKYNLKVKDYDNQIKDFLNSNEKKTTIKLNNKFTLEIEDTSYDSSRPIYTVRYIEEL